MDFTCSMGEKMKQSFAWSKFLFPIFSALFYTFFYLPLLILVIFSFNGNRFKYEWSYFTTKWYVSLWNNTEVWHAAKNSFIVASSSVFLCLAMSSLFIFYGSKIFVRRMLPLFYGNLATPEIVLAVGLVSLFYFLSVPLSLSTLIAAHTVLGLGYVVPIIHDRYRELDRKYLEASMDLGATQWQTFRLVVLPLLSPALLTSSILVFIISFEDFCLSFFCSGGSTLTLPLFIYSRIRAGASPMISALSTVLLLLSSTVVLLFLSLQRRGERK